MKVDVRAREVEPKDTKPKALKVSCTLDPETAQQVVTMAEREGLPVPEAVRTLIVGALSAYPRWGIKAADRRRAFNEQKHAILANLYAWFNEQRWIMDQQIQQEHEEQAP